MSICIEKIYAGVTISLNLKTGGESNPLCETGEEIPDAEVISDLMLNHKQVKIEVSCVGCKLFPGGFTKTVSRKIV